jgi:hypothetical protein
VLEQNRQRNLLVGRLIGKKLKKKEETKNEESILFYRVAGGHHFYDRNNGRCRLSGCKDALYKDNQRQNLQQRHSPVGGRVQNGAMLEIVGLRILLQLAGLGKAVHQQISHRLRQ